MPIPEAILQRARSNDPSFIAFNALENKIDDEAIMQFAYFGWNEH